MNSQVTSGTRKAISGKKVLFLALTVLIVTASCWYGHYRKVWAYNHSPEHTMQIIDQFRTLQDVEAAGDYLTPTGKRLCIAVIQDAKSNDSSKDIILSKQLEPDKCIFRVSTTFPDGGSVIMNVILLHQDSQWKFEDIWVDSIKGKRTAMMMSYIMDHPYRAKMMMVWQNPEMGVEYAEEMVKYFTVGVKIGELLHVITAAL
jgi:hypothetical protein